MGTMDRYDQQLRADGRAVIRTRRWKVALLAVLGLPLTLLFVPLVFLSDVGTWGRIGSAVLLLVCGTMTAACTWRAVTRRPALVVDREGIAVGRKRARWSEIEGFELRQVQATTFAVVQGRDGHAPLSAEHPILRWMARESGSTLPNGLEVRPTPLVDWLNGQLRRWS